MNKTFSKNIEDFLEKLSEIYNPQVAYEFCDDRLEFVATGSCRHVYDLDKDHVLKFDVGCRCQNKTEIRVHKEWRTDHGIPKIVRYEKYNALWLVTERATHLTNDNVKKYGCTTPETLGKCLLTLSIGEIKQTSETHPEIQELLGNLKHYPKSAIDLCSQNLGIIDNKLVVLDTGVFYGFCGYVSSAEDPCDQIWITARPHDD